MLLVLGLCGAGGFRPPLALATTGSSDPSPAHYSLATAAAKLFLGQYTIQSVAGGARLSRGQMAIDFNSLHYLSGIASFNGYDAEGHGTTWVGSLYQFHQTVRDGMVIDILGPASARLFGKMFLRPVKGGDLVGQIALPTTRYAIHWHKNLSL